MYMVKSFCNRNEYFDDFNSLDQAKDYAEKFKRWHDDKAYCVIYKCELVEED